MMRAALPPTEGNPPAELAIVEHTVGYSEVVLQNGDRIRLHLFVEKFVFDAASASYMPVFRVVPELQLREVRGGVAAHLEECYRC